MNQNSNPTNKPFRDLKSALYAIVPILALISEAGCYRATGYDRPALIAQEIPAVGGERVHGLKSMAGAGDYYVGNDFVALAVDATPLSERSGIAGAPGGGSIVDIGYIALDTSYRRVPMPCDSLDRITTVVNQDPDLSLIFYDYKTFNGIGVSVLEMRGQIYDPKHKLAGADWDSQNFVKDVYALNAIVLGSLDRRFTLETIITNNSGNPVDIRNIGDLLFQRGGGFRVLVAANEDKSGDLLQPVWGSKDESGNLLKPAWGVDFPGTDFDGPSERTMRPLETSVRSGPVAFMGVEPGSSMLDCHMSIGLVPLLSEQFLVASDPQNSLSETRPIFPERFVAGSLDTGVPLEPNTSIRHLRRLHIKGGTSGQAEYTPILYTQNTPNQGTGIMNDMISELVILNEKKMGVLSFNLEGTGKRDGPVPSELRFERYIGPDDGDPTKDQDPNNWKLERLDWMEPYETSDNQSDYMYTPTTRFGIFLPVGDYRIISRNHLQSTTLQAGKNTNSQDRPSLVAPITIEENKLFSLGETLSPERSDVLSPFGSRISYAQTYYSLGTRNSDFYRLGSIQPMRFTISGLDVPDPHLRRFRGITSIFNPTAKMPMTTMQDVYGTFHFIGGNSALGVQLSSLGLQLWAAPGLYQVYGSRGPLSTLEDFQIDTYPAKNTGGRTLTVFPTPLPEGWLSIDTPGPSMTTTGGMLPCEQLASALAEGVNIVARTEMDHQADGDTLQKEIRADLEYLEFLEEIEGYEQFKGYNKAIGKDPLIVNARSSNLGDYGTVTAYFTPADSNARSGGARPSKGWSLADFLTQADGQYNVVHRPRGPQGIFNQLGFGPTLPLWWDQTGPLSLGKTNGQFDALEIMNASVIAESGIDQFWSEYKAVREDWFNLLNQQTHTSFTKAVGFSYGKYSQDTPVGLVRTYLNIQGDGPTQSEQGPILAALKSGSAVVSSGPLLDVSVAGVGPGGLATINGSPSTITLNVTILATDWMPVDEIRVIVNGQVATTLYSPKTELAQSEEDYRYFIGTIEVPISAGKDAWLVVEAGVPIETSGSYRFGSPWHSQMKGIYPIAITNPIFLSLTSGGYTPPGL